MNLIIKKDILLENLSNVSKAISSKNIIPVLSGIKFELTETGLYLTASDNDIMIQAFIDKNQIEKVEAFGSIVLQGRYILEIIRKLPGEFISLQMIDEYKIWIKSNTSEFNLNGIDPEEFPKNEITDTKNPIYLSKTELKNMILQTSFAASTQESRPLLTGINFNLEGNKFECVATDSYRLSKKVLSLDIHIEPAINIVIPCRNLLELIKILKDDEKKMEMHVFSNKILFKFDNMVFQSKLLNGTYPDTSKLIPTDFSILIECNSSELYDVIDRASLLTNDKEKNIIKLETQNDMLIVSSNSPEVGRVEENMKVIKKEGNDIVISFSSKYMMDALKGLKTNSIQLLFQGEIKPIILKEVGNDMITELILPIRTY